MSFIKSIVKSIFVKLGFEFKRIQKLDQYELKFDLSMKGALLRCVQRGLKVNSVIDIGASNGSWSDICLKYIPNASYLLIEAQEAHKESLQIFKNNHNNVDYIISAAGSYEGEIYFDNTGLFGGLASETPFEENCIRVPVITIDSEVKKNNLKPPYLIKLDTHGYELPILIGAKETIKNASLIILEAYNFKLTKDSLKYYEICAYMESIGFQSIEMVDTMLRMYDHTLWQMDIFFIPMNSKEFSFNSYV